VPSDESLEPLLAYVIQLFDDEILYAGHVARARQVGQTLHSLQTSTARLVRALQLLVDRRAGDRGASAALRQIHRQGLADPPDLHEGPAP